MQAKNKQKIVNKNNNGGIYTKEFKAHIISTMKNNTIFFLNTRKTTLTFNKKPKYVLLLQSKNKFETKIWIFMHLYNIC